MICPNCKTEYRDNYRICSDCGAELVEDDQMDPDGKSVANEVFIQGHKLICPICDGIHFTTRTSYLKNDGLNYLEDGWQSQSATNFICNECGYIFWFANPEHKLFYQTRNDSKVVIDYETTPAAIDECPSCFSKIQPGDQLCSNCGYRFNEH